MNEKDWILGLVLFFEFMVVFMLAKFEIVKKFVDYLEKNEHKFKKTCKR